MGCLLYYIIGKASKQIVLFRFTGLRCRYTPRGAERFRSLWWWQQHHGRATHIRYVSNSLSPPPQRSKVLYSTGSVAAALASYILEEKKLTRRRTKPCVPDLSSSNEECEGFQRLLFGAEISFNIVIWGGKAREISDSNYVTFGISSQTIHRLFWKS